MTDNEKSNIVSEEEFFKAIRGESFESQKPEPPKDVIDTLEEELKNQQDSNQKPNQEPPSAENQNVEKTSEEEKEAERKEAEIKAEEDKKLKRFGVRDTIEALIENNQWVDVAVKYGDKEYQNISELLAGEKPSKELFASLSQLQSSIREKNLQEEYVSIKGKDETKVKLINAILTGVDYEDLLDYNKTVVEPVQKLDFANQDLKITEAFVRQCLIDLDGIPPKWVNAEMEELKKTFKLIEKAEELQELVIKNYNDEIELRTQAQTTLKAKQEEELNNQIKAFRKNLKTQDFSDAFIKQAVNLRYTKEPDGKPHYVRFIEDKMKEDENFASNFMHFALDPDDFIKKQTSKVKVETQTKFMELAKVIPREQGSTQSKERSVSLSEADENFLQELNK